MRRGRLSNPWPLLGEFIAALAMLAILLLSFNPVTPVNSVLSSASAADNFATGVSWCGGDPANGQPAHSGACHACRANPVVLPDAPCESEPAFGALIDTRSGPVRDSILPIPGLPAFAPRAPPVAV